MLQLDYESQDEDATDQITRTHQGWTASAVMLFRKCMTPSVKKIISESSTDFPREMFAKLRHKFLQEDTNSISTIRTELNLCRQGPEDELTDFWERWTPTMLV